MQLIKEGGLFGGRTPPALEAEWTLKTPMMAAMHEDTTAMRSKVASQLEKLGLPSWNVSYWERLQASPDFCMEWPTASRSYFARLAPASRACLHAASSAFARQRRARPRDWAGVCGDTLEHEVHEAAAGSCMSTAGHDQPAQLLLRLHAGPVYETGAWPQSLLTQTLHIQAVSAGGMWSTPKTPWARLMPLRQAKLSQPISVQLARG